MNKTHRSGPTATIAAAVALTLSAGPTDAQGNTGSGAEASVLQEIVVTARKRGEELVDVPATVSALSAADQANLALDGMVDYLRQVPGALLVTAGPEYLSDVSIRGQGGGRNGFSESATGIYRNGIFVAGGGFGGRALSRLDYFDNASVEVYRGPQGALYGRNAVGGAINVISNRPQMQDGASFRGEIGSVDNARIEGVLNGVIAPDKAAVRVGFFNVDQDGGDITDVNTGRKLDTSKYIGARAQLLLNVTDRWQTRLTQEIYSGESAGFSALGRRLSTGLPPGRIFDPDVYLRNASRVGRVEIDETSTYLELDGDLDWADLSAVYLRKARKGKRFNEDLDHFLGLEGMAGVDLLVNQNEDFSRDGLEVRLASSGSGPLTWLLGADWQRSESDVLTANGGSVPATSSAALRAQAVRRDSALEKIQSWSVFGSVDYDITDRLTAAAELRYQRDEKDFRFQRIDLVTGPVQTSNPAWSTTLPGASLQYRFNESLNIYARYSSGFRPGGFNQAVSDLALLEYDPESAEGYEIGIKGRIPGWRMRFGLAAYYTVSEDLQVGTSASTTDTTFVLQNIPGATFEGVEAELSGLLDIGHGRLSYNIGAATQGGKFDPGSRVVVSNRVVDISNADVNRARDLTLNLSAFYTYPIRNGLDVVIGGSYREERGGFENATGGTTDSTGRRLEDYALYDARVAINGDGWRFSAYGKNLGEKVFVLQNVSNNNYYNEGRRYGLEFSLAFGGERRRR
jgi:outer membrane receptor protein involved in Fe transport